MRDTYFVFTVQAYESMSTQFGLEDNATLKVICETAEEALKIAQSIIQKKHYRVSEVTQFFYDHRIDPTNQLLAKKSLDSVN